MRHARNLPCRDQIKASVLGNAGLQLPIVQLRLRRFAAVGGAATLAFAAILALAAIIASFASAFAFAGVLAFASMLFFYFLARFLIAFVSFLGVILAGVLRNCGLAGNETCEGSAHHEGLIDLVIL